MHFHLLSFASERSLAGLARTSSCRRGRSGMCVTRQLVAPAGDSSPKRMHGAARMANSVVGKHVQERDRELGLGDLERASIQGQEELR